MIRCKQYNGRSNPNSGVNAPQAEPKPIRETIAMSRIAMNSCKSKPSNGLDFLSVLMTDE